MHGDEITQITSNGFRGHVRFHSCLKNNWAHIQRGDKGEYVKRLQDALPTLIYYACVDTGRTSEEAQAIVGDVKAMWPKALSRNGFNGGGDGIYGPDTAGAVSLYKDLLQIKSPGQRQVDDIIGIRTMKSMEKHMLRLDAEQPFAWPNG